MVAGLAGLVVFLTLHHAWIMPIWFIAPVGALMAGGGGAAVGAAYADLRPRLPGRPWTAVVVIGLVVTVLAPSIVIGELTGPMYAIAPDGGELLVPVPVAVTAFVGGLLATTTLTAAAFGALLSRSRDATVSMALAGMALALGPGHNIPLLGGSPATTKELTILAAVVVVAAVVLVEAEAILERR
jgi:hypothetical protein